VKRYQILILNIVEDLQSHQQESNSTVNHLENKIEDASFREISLRNHLNITEQECDTLSTSITSHHRYENEGWPIQVPKAKNNVGSENPYVGTSSFKGDQFQGKVDQQVMRQPTGLIL